MEKVIVAITTFNLEKYIAQGLNSILAQKTNFDYKIIVGDDCSQDGTLRILRDYEEKYPGKVEVLTFEKNLGSLANSNRIFDGIQCEYLAFMDGDDYWVGVDRLQKQVDYMDAHPECSICAGNTQYLIEGKPDKLLVAKEHMGKTYSFYDYTHYKLPFFHTSALLLRNTIFSHGLPECFKSALGTFEECALRGEDFRRILHLEQGNLYAMDELFSIYRIHDKGLWQSSSSIRKDIETAVGFHFYDKYFGSKYGTFFKEQANRFYQKMMCNMLVEQSMAEKYTLSEKDSFVFTGLLNDLSHNNPKTESHPSSRIKKKLIEASLKIQ